MGGALLSAVGVGSKTWQILRYLIQYVLPHGIENINSVPVYARLGSTPCTNQGTLMQRLRFLLCRVPSVFGEITPVLPSFRPTRPVQSLYFSLVADVTLQ